MTPADAMQVVLEAADAFGLVAWEERSHTGSCYVYVQAGRRELKIRFSDHGNLTHRHRMPDYNVCPDGDSLRAVLDALWMVSR